MHSVALHIQPRHGLHEPRFCLMLRVQAQRSGEVQTHLVHSDLPTAGRLRHHCQGPFREGEARPEGGQQHERSWPKHHQSDSLQDFENHSRLQKELLAAAIDMVDAGAARRGLATCKQSTYVPQAPRRVGTSSTQPAPCLWRRMRPQKVLARSCCT